jgi:hypothetical protein
LRGIFLKHFLATKRSTLFGAYIDFPPLLSGANLKFMNVLFLSFSCFFAKLFEEDWGMCHKL